MIVSACQCLTKDPKETKEPVIDQKKFRKLLEYVLDALEQGVRILTSRLTPINALPSLMSCRTYGKRQSRRCYKIEKSPPFSQDFMICLVSSFVSKGVVICQCVQALLCALKSRRKRSKQICKKCNSQQHLRPTSCEFTLPSERAFCLLSCEYVLILALPLQTRSSGKRSNGAASRFSICEESELEGATELGKFRKFHFPLTGRCYYLHHFSFASLPA